MNSTVSFDKLKSRSAKLTKQPMRASDLLGSPLVGLWKARKDVHEAGFARSLRKRFMHRKHAS